MGITLLVRARATNCRINVALDKANLAYTLRFDNDCCEMQALNNLLQSRELGARLNAIKATSKIDVHKSNSVIEMRVPLA